jgi:tripartite-type tricarboxylate transporter receptor subunit TctC
MKVFNMKQSNRRQAIATMASSIIAISASPFAFAQSSFPNKPLKIIIPQPPGGGFDFVGRVLGERLGKQLGQSIVAENKPGSGTLVGTDFVAKSAADGYTMLVGSVSNMALNMGLYDKLPYDSLRDFELVGLASSYSYTLMARKDLPFKDLRELIAYAKANANKLSYASAGNGSGQHVLAAALWHLAGVELIHVPYRGAQAAYQDLLGGRVDVFFDLAPTARVQVDAGTVRALATSGAARNPMHADVPTLIETGVTGAAALELESWFGLFVPSKTPADIQAVLRTELAKVIASTETASLFTKAGGRPLALKLEDAKQLVRRDVERWTRLVKTIGIKPE